MHLQKTSRIQGFRGGHLCPWRGLKDTGSISHSGDFVCIRIMTQGGGSCLKRRFPGPILTYLDSSGLEWAPASQIFSSSLPHDPDIDKPQSRVFCFWFFLRATVFFFFLVKLFIYLWLYCFLFLFLASLFSVLGQASVAVVHGLNVPMTYAIFPDQRSNLCSLHWQADS